MNQNEHTESPFARRLYDLNRKVVFTIKEKIIISAFFIILIGIIILCIIYWKIAVPIILLLICIIGAWGLTVGTMNFLQNVDDIAKHLKDKK